MTLFKTYLRCLSQRLYKAYVIRQPVRSRYSYTNFLKTNQNVKLLSRFAKAISGVSISLLLWSKARNEFTSVNCDTEPYTKYSLNKDERKDDHDDFCTFTLQEAINKGRDLLQRIKDETGSPGIVVGVSIDGQDVWKEGLGYSDIENRVPCTASSVFRIASISKSITMGLVAKLWENGDLDLDKPIHQYLPQFPVKSFNNEKVEITTGQLVSHLGGIRHYDKTYIENQTSKDKENTTKSKESKPPSKDTETTDGKTKEQPKRLSEFQNKEYYIKKHYNTVTESLNLFKDDPLVNQPGSKFLYTSHGWTLISAVMEKAANQSFDKLIQDYFRTLGLTHTYLEHNEPLVYNRGRHYMKNKNGRIINAPYVDNSYKWAGGGFISDVTDLLRFGNIMLYSYQFEGSSQSCNTIKEDKPDKNNNVDTVQQIRHNEENSSTKGASSTTKQTPTTEQPPGYLQKKTMEMIFSPVDKTECSWDKDASYGMGWAVVPEKYERGFCRHQRHYVSHTGGAIGASSILLIMPRTSDTSSQGFVAHRASDNPPKGIVVAIVNNLGSVNLNKTALDIAQVFEQVN